MEIKLLDHTNKIMYLTNITDEDAKLLNFIKYIHCNEYDYKDENGNLVEVYRPISLILFEKIGKWVAFRQDGMSQTLHGQVIRVNGGCFVVKCKNGCRRYPNASECYKFFDNKEECYNFKMEG